MLSNKIVADKSHAGSQNSAHIGKAGRYNEMMPMPAAGGPIGATSPNDLPQGILNGNSVPMTLDSHAGGRHAGTQNLAVKPGEKSRAARTTEIHKRIHGRSTEYKY
jgi:hypothetical protein